MKVLKSHRDSLFQRWRDDAWVRQRESVIASFGYVSVKRMQRGDTTPESQEWLDKNQKQNKRLREHIAKSIDEEGMRSPFILVSVNNKHWKKLDKFFWKSIPFVIQTGNNRYQYALENGYTHISSIILGVRVTPRTWNYLQDELKRPISAALNLDKGTVFTNIGEWEWKG